MKSWKLNEMKEGWFVGDFFPTCYRTKEFEVAYKIHKVGQNWPKHYQKKAIEINLVTKGVIKMGGKIFQREEIFIIPPMQSLKPEFLTDCEVVCVKIPSIPNDKVEG